jgi:hypothetical protein
MSTPNDELRTAAIRAWFEHIGGIPKAHQLTGIATRTLERFRAGTQPPPVRLLERLAEAHRAVETVELSRLLWEASQATRGLDDA